MTPVPRSVKDWFLLITESRDDAKLVKQAIAELDGLWAPELLRRLHLVNLLTAVRLDQTTKEGSA
jgi:hypothetical protein